MSSISSVKFDSSIPSLPILPGESEPGIIIKDPNNSNNKATVKKMVIADPGLGMEIDFETDIDVYNHIIQIDLGKKINGVHESHHKFEITFVAPKSLMSYPLNNTSIIVVPFVDLHFLNYIDRTLNVEEHLSYKITVLYQTSISNPPEFISLTAHGLIDPKIVSKKGKFGWNPYTIDICGEPLPNSIDLNGTSYKDIIFHELGAVFNVKYPKDTILNNLFLNLRPNNSSTGPYIQYNNKATIKTDHWGFFWLPFPKVSGQVVNIEDPYIQHTGTPLLSNNCYDTTDLCPATGEMIIEVVVV